MGRGVAGEMVPLHHTNNTAAVHSSTGSILGRAMVPRVGRTIIIIMGTEAGAAVVVAGATTTVVNEGWGRVFITIK